MPDPSTVRPRRRCAEWVREASYVAIFTAASLVLTWPMARDFTTHNVGDRGDPYVILWTMRWMRDALFSLRNPFFTDHLYHPFGVPLVFDAFDLPTTLLVVPLWDLLPEVAIYNIGVLFAYTLTAYGMFRLAREITDDTAAAIAAGVLFAAVPYHSAHLQGHLNLVSMGWIPLYLVHVIRITSGRGRPRDAYLGGVFLALASVSSWYYLLFAIVLTLPFVVYDLLSRSDATSSWRSVRQGLVLAVTWFILAGPLFVAMVATSQREEMLGAHSPETFSADGYSFFVRSVAQTVCEQRSLPEWIGYIAEHATYAGFVVLALALVGAAVHPIGRVFLGTALVGALLTLGPYLNWKGENLGIRMPYWYLQAFVPALAVAGVPVRFGFVMYVGLIAAAACGLSWLRARAKHGSIGVAVVVICATVALYDYWPCLPPTSQYPLPPPLREWARDRESWVVLDVTDPWQQMWHAAIHRKAIIGGHLGRVPKRLEDWISVHPVIRAISRPDVLWTQARIDPGVDFAWSGRPPDPGLTADSFAVEWTGTLLVPTAGRYRFWLTTTVGARLQIDARRAAGQIIVYPPPRRLRDLSGEIALDRGPHALVLRTTDAVPEDEIHLSWAPPGRNRQLVPTDVLRTADGQPGLDARYEQHVSVTSGLGRDHARATLRDLGIRYVITPDVDNVCLQRELELPLEYRGDGVRIYRVDESPDAAARARG